MTIFNLITMLGERVSGIEPIICGDQQDAVAYSCGALTERTKAHAEMYANLNVHWSLEEGERSLGDATVPAGRKVGTWQLVFSGGQPKLVWADYVGQKRLKSSEG
ncbi:MAG: hypothetical protein P0Y50_13785 [Candidatus Brevundimonas colombiensis]|uniref:Uncharacterized protein n=1 Tax=Candidatus Brevundimonas colombiensis TaxID=3121376 RepID=A0AAJ6BL37_9CAUL|nr:hypothetical protein [Brevundimonas sp.]WEK39589.1 MAG: hypothetical protein P0Y50_13785 [Brevundimonas sp.]